MPESPEEESTLDLSDLAYPILAFWLDRDAAGERTSDKGSAIPREMAVPTVFSWVKQSYHTAGTRIQAGDIGPLKRLQKKNTSARFSDVVGP